MLESRSSTTAEPGILHPTRSRYHFDYLRHQPDGRLIPFVENIWTVTWNLTSSGPYVAQVLPYPSVNASVTNEDAMVTGVTRSRYDRRLTGRGHVVGARFRPGCFRPFLRGAVSTLTDTAIPMSQVLGRDTGVLQEAVSATSEVHVRVGLLSAFLLDELPPVDQLAQQVATLVAEVAERPDIVRVRQLASLAGMSERRLQRVYVDYVGVGPKWVIARCRLQDAAARAAEDPGVDWSSLAAELGFADQAHLTRAFSRIIGKSPAAYAAQLRAYS